MVRGLTVVILAPLFAPTLALAAERAPAPGFLDPTAIAHRYANRAGADALASPVFGPVALGVRRPEPARATPARTFLAGRLLEYPSPAALLRPLWMQRAHHDDSFGASTRFEAEEAGAGATVRKLRQRLFLDVDAYTRGGSSAYWDGLHDELDERGRTLRLGGGRVLGDLTVGVGANQDSASVLSWWEGEAALFDVNPFRDVSAQLDIAILSERRGGVEQGFVVLRLRGSYQGAFELASDPEQRLGAGQSSEVGLSLGFQW